MNVFVIGNPVAGSGWARHRIEELVNILKQRGHRVEVFLTRGSGEAKRWVTQIKPDIETIVVSGGDGTLNEVLNGLDDPCRVPIALLPTGSANVLAHELGLPSKPKEVADIIDRGIARRLDMGQLNDRRFLLLVSAGIDATVTETIHRSRKGTLGYRGYLLPLLEVIARYRVQEVKVTVDGREPVKGSLAVVSNVKNYGGIFSITDRARCDSGHLDLCIFPRSTIPALFRYTIHALRGRVSRLADVTYLTGRRIRIESEEPVAVQVDGDYFGTTPVVIELLPACVPILVPHAPPTHCIP